MFFSGRRITVTSSGRPFAFRLSADAWLMSCPVISPGPWMSSGITRYWPLSAMVIKVLPSGYRSRENCSA